MDASERRAVVLADRLTLLVDAVEGYAIFMLDPDGFVVTWNSGAERIKGYRADEIVGEHFSRFYIPEDVAIGKPGDELAAARRDGVYRDEGWRVRKDGSRFWANVHITAVFDPSGRHEGYAKVTRDDTDRLIAGQRIRQLELLAERDRISQELSGTVVHQIYSATLVLHSALSLTQDGDVAARIREAIIELDDAVHQIRDVVVDGGQRRGTDT